MIQAYETEGGYASLQLGDGERSVLAPFLGLLPVRLKPARPRRSVSFRVSHGDRHGGECPARPPRALSSREPWGSESQAGRRAHGPRRCSESSYILGPGAARTVI
jgi:hypothetical protein